MVVVHFEELCRAAGDQALGVREWDNLVGASMHHEHLSSCGAKRGEPGRWGSPRARGDPLVRWAEEHGRPAPGAAKQELETHGASKRGPNHDVEGALPERPPLDVHAAGEHAPRRERERDGASEGDTGEPSREGERTSASRRAEHQPGEAQGREGRRVADDGAAPAGHLQGRDLEAGFAQRARLVAVGARLEAVEKEDAHGLGRSTTFPRHSNDRPAAAAMAEVTDASVSLSGTSHVGR